MIKLFKNKNKAKKNTKTEGLENENLGKLNKAKSNKLTRAELKQIRAARRARAKARSSTKLSVRLVGLTLALVLTAGFVIPGTVMVWKTFFGAKSTPDFDMEKFRKLLEEFSKMKKNSPEGDEEAGSDDADSEEADAEEGEEGAGSQEGDSASEDENAKPESA